MKKVYVVTAGEYSDYHIEAIFSSKEKAIELVSKSSHLDLNEYEIDKPITDFIFIQVHMKKNGDVSKTMKQIGEFISDGFYRFNVFTSRSDDELIWIVKTDNEKRAIKATNEKRSQIIAAECWNDNKKTRELFNH